MLLEIKTRNTGSNMDYQAKSQSRTTSNQFHNSYCNMDIEAVNQPMNSVSNKNIKLLVQSNSNEI